MQTNQGEIKRREGAARSAIRKAFGAPGNESGVTLFVAHHLEVLDPQYWKGKMTGRVVSPDLVLDLLIFKRHWGGDAQIEVFDFTLPDDVTNYVIAAKFDDSGVITEISMES